MVKIAENPFIIIDGSSYLYRAYHAFPPLTNCFGEPIGAIYGVINMLKSLLVEYHPSHLAVVFDAKGKTFRDVLFENYKSHRPPMPENLRLQIAPLHKIVKAMGLPLLAVNGVEADDVIGTLALAAVKNGHYVLISTSDKDMAQLVSPKITLINTMSNTILGPEEVRLKFGVPPELIVDYLALMGDSADNIPGVPGVGKKTSQALLRGLGGLKTLYQQLDSIRTLSFRGAKTMAEKLIQHREVAFLSHQLATIKTNVELNIPYERLAVENPNIASLMLLFQRYEFKRWLDALKAGKWLQGPKIPPSPSSLRLLSHPTYSEAAGKSWPKDGYQLISETSTLQQWITTIRNAGAFAFNITADGLDALTANLVGLCFSVKPGETAYVPLKHYDLDAPMKLNLAIVLSALKPVLEDPAISKIGQNLKFARGILQRYNIALSGIAFDTMLESYVLNSIAGAHDINSLSDRFLQITTEQCEGRESQGHNRVIFNQCDLQQSAYYAGVAADLMLRLHQKLWPSIQQTPKLKKVFEVIDMPLVPILSRMECAGVLIDENILLAHSVELTQRLEALEKIAHQLAEEPFNLSSTKQLQTILYDKQKLPVLKKTPLGAPSTNEEVLTQLGLYYQLPSLILEYRGLAKIKAAYADKLPKMIHPLSKRVHTSYHQAVTSTGRLSSSDPNLQNIPVRTDEGRRIRQAFIAPTNTLIVSADYSQLELRIMAHLSHDPVLLSAFFAGQDIHRTTASDVFNMPLEKVTQDQRRSAKAINFGLLYGISTFGLARQLSVTQTEAKKYMQLYFERHPSILAYIERTRRQASDQGYVSTLDGRRLYFPDILSHNHRRKKSAERAAINAPMQGTAADIIKRAMIAIDEWLEKEAPPVRMIMQVHDELVFEVQRDEVESAISRIKLLMERCFMLDVPLEVKAGVGENWAEAH
ncbi:DNA polymerase I [secondary endosymbiont of Ctenarytaina eucalypti]|uniref:DNA polymerase I n=1 Tax=secondary endosymbiont of Ctenarytaina eucalypti TaxID=1199245 RepID=J3VTH2_9ENTR|nr:DNA polymerase I [secondary endosymbiont of Ctenarytaina eucalypti]AFP85276.1 DNA polymerase I [secondary endosymbiont of Ctenarytaina eucalypti]